MGQEQTFTNVQPIEQTFSAVTPIDGSTSDDNAAPEPSFYQKLTDPFSSGYTNPVARTLAATGAAAIGAPAAMATSLPRSKTVDQMADLLMPQKGQSAPIPKTDSGGSLSLWDSLKAWGDPNTWKGAASVLPEALGTGIGNVAVAEAAGKVSTALPSAKRAGAALQDIRNTAGHVPIDMNGPGDTAMQIYWEAKHGAYLPPPVNALLKRMGLDPSEITPYNRPISYQTAVNRGVVNSEYPPLTYAEAKSFQQNISNLSAQEKMGANPNIKRLVGQLNSVLKDSLEDAADTVGKGQKFAQAMQEYHHAMQLQGFTEAAIKAALGAAATGLGVGAVKKLWESF